MLVSQHHRYSSSYPARPIASNFLTQFTNWAKIWVSSSSPSFTPRKRKLISIDTTNFRETDIRSRVNYYDQSCSSLDTTIPTISQRASLYRATCQKLRPNHSKLTRLGDIIHVRRFWDNLEKLVYQEMSNTNHHYVPPSKRMPFNPDKLGSLYRPKKSRKLPPSHFQKRRRPSFSSSTIVYTLTTKQHVQILPLLITCRILPRPQVPQTMKRVVHQQQQDDDDDVPLGALLFS